MFTFVQRNGGWYSPSGVLIGHGYSGFPPDGVNNPKMQGVRGVGPIPQGMWHTDGNPYDSDTTGLYSIKLVPMPGTNVFGRGSFRMHGDLLFHPGFASHGCIVLPRSFREGFWDSGDHQIHVVGEVTDLAFAS